MFNSKLLTSLYLRSHLEYDVVRFLNLSYFSDIFGSQWVSLLSEHLTLSQLIGYSAISDVYCAEDKGRKYAYQWSAAVVNRT